MYSSKISQKSSHEGDPLLQKTENQNLKTQKNEKKITKKLLKNLKLDLKSQEKKMEDLKEKLTFKEITMINLSKEDRDNLDKTAEINDIITGLRKEIKNQESKLIKIKKS